MWGKMDGGGLGRIHEAKFKNDNWFTDQGAKVNTTYVPSPASKLYREAIKEYLTALRQHIEAQPYGKAVIGYHLCWGYDMQWNWPTGNCQNEVIGKNGSVQPRAWVDSAADYSNPMKRYFRDYLRHKYVHRSGAQGRVE